MPVYSMLDTMPYVEFVGWMEYLSRRPIGWRDDARAYRVIQFTSFAPFKKKAHEVFATLDRVFNGTEKDKRTKANQWNNPFADYLRSKDPNLWTFIDEEKKDGDKS